MASDDLILQFERQQDARLERLEKRIDEIEKELGEHSKNVSLSFKELILFQKQHEETLDTLNGILHGSQILKWIVTAVLGTMAAIGVIATGVEIIARWWQK